MKKTHINNTTFDLTDIQGSKTKRDIVVSIKDKENVHCMMGMPLAVTYQDSDFLPISLAVHILGASTSSRLFETLRIKRSLTYGSYAKLAGYAQSHPGMLYGMAIFPTTVFLEGRTSMYEIMSQFAQHGVTKKEVAEHAEEVTGSYAVKLASTIGKSNTLFSVLKAGLSVRYLDTYIDAMQSLTHREVNSVLKRHLDSRLIKTASAGGVQKNGKQL